eukprot:CAMPEP_0171307088 /NCGR_PEP_ID=MMETSP0816-20121228/17106_1 /TAXON_ID=420281 /ORGANISM="Proboscia inermis, Strain CCAP1064/1" /LENGTH=64 /DNA_ID=CAMNT_0011789053 /DNA_START=1 /DNA_END=191 /DNA_ORIENTATION=-
MENDWTGVENNVLWEPPDDNSSSLQQVQSTRDYLFLSVLEHVRTRLLLWQRTATDGWVRLGDDS